MKKIKIIVDKIRAFLGLTHNVLVISFFMGLLGTSITYTWFPFLPLFLEELGATIIQIGMAFMVSSAAHSISEVLGGYLGDKYGRKIVIVTGSFFVSFTYLALVMATSWLVATAALTLVLMLDGIYMPAINSMISESVPEEQLGTAYGSFWFFLSLAYILGPLIGAILIPLFGYRPLFFFTAIVGFVVSLLAYILLKETLAKKRKHEELEKKIKLSQIFRGPLLYYFISVCTTAFGDGLMLNYVVIYAKRYLYMAESEIGLMFSVANFSGLMASFPAGKIADKVGKRIAIASGILVAAIAQVIWLYSQSFFAALIVYAIYRAATIVPLVSHNALIANLTSEEVRASVMGLFMAAVWIVSSISTFIGGLLWETVNPQAPFVAYFLIQIPGLMLLIHFVKEKN